MSSAPTIHLQRAKMLVSGIVYPVYSKLWWSKRIWRKQITYYVFKTIAWLCWKSGRVILFLSPLNSTHHTIRVEISSKHISLRDSKKKYIAQTDGAKVTWSSEPSHLYFPEVWDPLSEFWRKKLIPLWRLQHQEEPAKKIRNADFVLHDGAWVSAPGIRKEYGIGSSRKTI